MLTSSDIEKMWPKHSDGSFVDFNDELPQFCDTIYKKVKTIGFNERGYAITNSGGSANRRVIGDFGQPVEEARVY